MPINVLIVGGTREAACHTVNGSTVDSYRTTHARHALDVLTGVANKSNTSSISHHSHLLKILILA